MTQGMTSTTAMAGPPPQWDEDGNYIEPVDPNIRTIEFSCSEGHKWVQKHQHGDTWEEMR